MSEKGRIVIALVLAACGLILAGRALQRSRQPSSAELPNPVSPHVQATLDRVELDAHPKELGVPAVLSRARVRAQEAIANSAVPADRRADLVDAFVERLAATIGGDFARHRADLISRGDTLSGAAAEEERERWTRTSEFALLSPVSLAGLEVRLLISRGARVAPDPVKEGFSTLLAEPLPGRFPFSKPLSDVVEVRLPLLKKTVNTRAARTVLVGYWFTWSPDRRRWIPVATCVYSAPDEIHSAIPF